MLERYLLQMGRIGAGHLPVLFSINFVAMLVITYSFSVWRGDVDPVFPYISASGDSRPESCIFSMFLNVCAFFIELIVILRYHLVAELLSQNSDQEEYPLISLTNRLSLFAGLLGGVGMFIVANFQETAVIQIHLTGALLSFGSGCIYMLIQSFVCFKMFPKFVGKRIVYIRLSIAIASTFCFFAAFFLGLAASLTFHHYFPDLPTPRPWNRKFSPMPGYGLHCLSAVAEWTLAILHMSFLLSYSREFEKIRVEFKVKTIVQHLDHSPLSNSNTDLLNI
uniref:CWH43-like N-terminal domain-containing protein n=1 Tax=Meloidogyne incognita TaxID=6306 RepID=A0A914LZS8_MELIC